MNEKLKKGLKVGGIVLGLLAYGLCAFGIGACSRKPATMVNAESLTSEVHNYMEDATHLKANKLMWVGGSIQDKAGFGIWYFPADYSIPTGYYRLTSPDGAVVNAGLGGSLMPDADSPSYVDNYSPQSSMNESNVENGGSYIYFDNVSNLYISTSYEVEVLLELVDALDIPPSDYVTLPPKWAPLNMFGGSVSNEGNILTNSEWQTGYEEKIVLWGFLFRNQGVVYNRFRIHLAWIGGSTNYTEVGYLDGNGDFVKGLQTQWVISFVEYAFNLTDNLNNNVDDLYSYRAGSCGVDAQGNKVVYSLGLNWVNDKANTIEIVDAHYKTSNGTRYTYGGIPIGANLSDLDFLKAYNNLTSSEIGAISNGDVFTLLSSGFNSFLPILNISVIPGITFGLLLFLPIFAGIIVIIIKVIKK